MFFKKLFRKDPASCMEKGDKFLAAGRYADARVAFDDALEALDASDPSSASLSTAIREKMAMAGNRLAEVNIAEAEACIRGGDMHKAEDHLNLSLELADDVTIREKTEKLLSSLLSSQESTPQPAKHVHSKGCGGGCSSSSCHPSDSAEISEDGLSESDRFELLVRPLPGDLPERYLSLGKEFAKGYLAAHEGDLGTAWVIFERLLAQGENDVLLYELSLLSHREGDRRRCEALLRRCLQLNEENPLGNLGLVQFLAESSRFDEAIALLESMLQRGILPEQSELFLGDLRQARGEHDAAIEHYSRLLGGALKKEAAQRLVPMLEASGRHADAAYVAKQLRCC